jgi:alanyl-tRNA synthetase
LADGKSVEIWNLVFTQFNRVGEPPDNLRPLPSKNIDTGMGLERTASVLQGVPTNFHIDNLMPILQAAASVTGTPYEYASDNGRRLRRITDHIRACTFAVHENVYPGPDKAKYVVRRLIRRAVLDGHQMGLRDPFLFQIVPAVAEAMRAPYPELGQTIDRVSAVIRKEEEAFFGTLDAALSRIDQMFARMKSDNRVMVDGHEAAELYQTYGVPPELLQTMSAERNLTFGWDGFREAMARHAEDSGGDQRKLFQTGPLETLKEALRETPFLGYEQVSAQAVIKGIITGQSEDDERLIGRIEAGGSDQLIRVVLDRTPFYGESGGQVGDQGSLHGENFEFSVIDVQKHAGLIVHFGRMIRGKMSEGDSVTAKVDVSRRDAIRRAHSATHVLHYALQKNLGRHAQQQGSKVEGDALRFDFTNQEALDDTTVAAIAQDVLDRVAANEPITWQTVSLADARAAGAMMLFGEKYPDPVRMVSMGQFSKELCGGTHLNATGEIGAFEVVSEESVSSNTRRIVALTGPKAEQYRQEITQVLAAAAKQLSVNVPQVADATRALIESVRRLKKALTAASKSALDDSMPTLPATQQSLNFAEQRKLLRDVSRLLNVGTGDILARLESLQKERLALAEQLSQLTAVGEITADEMLADAEAVGGALLIVRDIPGANANLMRQWIDQLRKKSAKPVAVLLATVAGPDTVTLVAGLSHALVDQGIKAGHWVGEAAKGVGGGGGGRPDLAQAGGKNPDQLPAALTAARDSMRAQLAKQS